MSESDRERLLVRRWRDRVYRARNLTYLAMTMVVIGMIVWWLSEPQGLALPLATLPGVLLGMGLLAYLFGWCWLLWLRLREDPRRRQD